MQCTIRSRLNAYYRTLDFLILNKVTNDLPVHRIAHDNLEQPKNIQLADPEFTIPGRIDMLLGAESFYQLLCIGQIQPAGSKIIFQKTLFGWVASGRLEGSQARNPAHHHRITTTSTSIATHHLSQQLRLFWEIEEITTPRTQSKTETKCEEIYRTTVRRESSGRYIVHLPFDKAKLNQIGDTRDQAIRRFLSLEGRLERNPDLKRAYVEFMTEYQQLGHMRHAPHSSDTENPSVYLPHHAIRRAESSTTKLRVVFDGSAKGSTGVALNDALLVGPGIQDDLFSIIARFRLHRYVMTGDVEKMYRQIRVHEPHTHLQKIIWRENPQEPLQTFVLTTVTYGTSAAPFLATRTLLQLAKDEGEKHPLAFRALCEDFYVDDLLTGTDDLTEALELQEQLTMICRRGGFKLRKWCANDAELINKLPADARGTVHNLTITPYQATKTLGVLWNPTNDNISYSVTHFDSHPTHTKRTVVSEMAQLFDPLGLIGPVIIRAKIFVQTLWRLQLNWDESLPIAHHSNWTKYREELLSLNKLQLPRRVISVHSAVSHQLHIFCDASERAYGACAYVRSMDAEHGISSHLLCSKSRVVPLKSITIPRLELCAALLAARLAAKLEGALKLQFNTYTIWSDSTIVLAWLREPGDSTQWKQFVANRVAEIHELTGHYQWRHVKTQDNPADHISRGLTPTELMCCQQWWNGPTWLLQAEEHWPRQPTHLCEEQIPEQKPPKAYALTTYESPILDQLLTNYSSLTKLQRTLAWCLRFIKNLPNRKESGIMEGTGRRPVTLTAYELNKALLTLIRHTQAITFASELDDLITKGQVTAQSKIRSLNPFVDAAGILRVGGRLQNATIQYDMKHPIILTATTRLAQMLIDFEHRRLLHASPQQLQASLRQKYWIIAARNAIRRRVHACTTCYRWRAQAAKQLMGSLPATRTNPCATFTICGVDYGGPFTLRLGHSRSKARTKAYVALFVCFATRAIHLELVSNLTTDAFLAAFRRFIARRGRPHEVNSDNGTTFVGANRQLGEFIKSLATQATIIDQAAMEGITWKFIPPHAPHFGGLWEAGIKATKHHMKRVIGETILSFEELYTILTQIESTLNSRPLFPLTNDPNDFEVLTPGHFLIGRAPTAFPEPDYPSERSLYKRWHMLQQLVQHFWKRWHHEYLLLLQQRPKWATKEENLKIGTLVLIKEDHQAPLTWNKGRIVELHTGADNLVRVVTIQTTKGTIRRPIHKICPLPMQPSEVNSD